MDKYTPERLLELANLLACDTDKDEEDAANALRAYAATLRQQAARVDEGMMAALREIAALRWQSAATNGCAHGAVSIATAALAALAQNTQGDGEPVAESCSDHVKGETGYCTFLAPVPFGTKLYLHAERARVPEGCVLVPRELTPEMHAAFFKTHGEVGWLDKGWAAMLAARTALRNAGVKS